LDSFRLKPAEGENIPKNQAAERAAEAFRLILNFQNHEIIVIFLTIHSCLYLFRLMGNQDQMSLNFFEGYFFQNIHQIMPTELLLIIQWILWVFENQNLSIEGILGNSGMILEIVALLNEYQQFLEDVIERYDDFLDNGAAQVQAQKAIPLITPASAESQFVSSTEFCAVCMEVLSGKCLMSKCKHALHEQCMKDMFNSCIDACPSCRRIIETLEELVIKKLEESPKASDEASSGGSPADAAPESPKASKK
jgi:hypothetical protein